MKLSDTNNKNPFTVPDGYFDNFYDRLQNKFNEQPKQEVNKLNFNLKMLQPMISIAAIILLVLMLVNIDQKQPAYLPNEDSYITDILYEMDDLSFSESYYSEEVELTNDDLEYYILNNVTEYEIINNLY